MQINVKMPVRIHLDLARDPETGQPQQHEAPDTPVHHRLLPRQCRVDLHKAIVQDHTSSLTLWQN